MVIFFIVFIIVLLILIYLEISSAKMANSFAEGLSDKKNDSLFSLIVAAKNEEKDIGGLLSSLEALEDDHFELIIIADRCIDSTKPIVENFSKNSKFPVTILENSVNPPRGISPKVPLLQMGIEAAKGEILLFTDADCIVPKDWISQYRRLFSDSTTGLATGGLEIITDGTLLGAYQNFDDIYRSFYAIGCIGRGVPTGGYGNNLGMRKSCYEALGGYDNLPNSVTEDAVLVSEVGKLVEYKVRALPTYVKRVKTRPQNKLKAYISQIHRWALGAVRSPDRQTALFYNLLMLTLTFSNISAIISIFYRPFLLVPFIGFTFMMSTGIIAGIFMKAGKRYWRAVVPSVFLFFIFYQISFLTAIFSRTVKWKDAVVFFKN